MSHIPGLGLDGVPVGTHFLMASLQSLFWMPVQNASSSAPTLLSDPTAFSVSQAFHSCPKALPHSDKSPLTSARVFSCNVPIPTFRSQLFLFSTLMLIAWQFSVLVSCLTRSSLSSLPSFLSHFSVYDSRPLASKSFPSLLSLQAPSLPSPSAASFSRIHLHWPHANFFPLTPLF